MTYIIRATAEDHNGVRVSCNTPEYLGDAYIHLFALREHARRWADVLQAELGDYEGLHPSTIYSVEEVVASSISDAGQKIIEDFDAGEPEPFPDLKF